MLCCATCKWNLGSVREAVLQNSLFERPPGREATERPLSREAALIPRQMFIGKCQAIPAKTQLETLFTWSPNLNEKETESRHEASKENEAQQCW